MDTSRAPEKSRAVPLILAAVIFVLWMAPGLTNRDLWKADEPYSFGMIHHILKTGDWVVPTLAGMPFMEKPPAFFLTAAGFARLFSPWLELHDGARLACAFYLLLTVLFVGLAAKELLGNNALPITMIMLIGSTGLQVTSHKLITDNAMIAGLAMTMYGLTLCRRRPLLGGVLLGTGAGLGFMSKGLLAPGLVALTALALPAVFSEWRKKEYLRTLLASGIAVLPWAVIWPLALYLRDRGQFIEWFWYQNLGRFLGYAYVGREFSLTYYFVNLPWFALPAFPIALWALWQLRSLKRIRPEMQVPLVMFLVMFIVLTLSSSIRNIYALPLLLPVILLAAIGMDSFPQKARRVMNVVSLWLFGILACLLWFSWFASLKGSPAFIVDRLYRLQPDHVVVFNRNLFAIACAYSVLWIAMIAYSSRFAHAYLINWTAGTVLAWGLLMSIWLPWLDAGSGYRSLFESLRENIPYRCNFVITQGLGESERALLEYYAGVKSMSVEGRGVWDCDYLLLQDGSLQAAPPAGPEWQLVWQMKRPSEASNRPAKEIFTLLQRRGGKQLCQEAVKVPSYRLYN